jgi:hypothetical protein
MERRFRHRPDATVMELASPSECCQDGGVAAYRVPAPGMVSALAMPDLPGVPRSVRARGSDPSDNPLVAFDSPSRYWPSVPARSRGDVSRSRRTGTSLGVSFPYSALGAASPRPEVALGFRRRVPPRRLRCRSRAFSAPQRPCSSPHLPAVFRRVALLGFMPFRGSCPGCSRCGSSPPRTLLTFFPWTALSPS